MREYSEEVNLYIETNSPIDSKVLPSVASAKGKYNRIAPQLENANSRQISNETLEKDYNDALTVFENYIVSVYRILSGKGYLTESEWELILNNISDSRYIFSDLVLKLGTTRPWIFKGEKEEFVKSVLKRKGFYNIKIIPSSDENRLFDTPNNFINDLKTSLSINMVYEDIEKALNGKGYIGTKQRFNYLTIYDFLKFHLKINQKPLRDEFINILENCKDKNIINIRSAKSYIQGITGDFWKEYERYRGFKMLCSLVYWFSKSSVRYLTEDMYEYFVNNVDNELLRNVLSELKVHTAVLNTRRTKIIQKGTNVTFSNFSIDSSSGTIYATVEKDRYADSFSSASTKIKLTSTDSLTIGNLTYNCTYYVSIWEVFDDQDAVKLGNLKTVTPGVEWPRYDYILENTGEKNNDFNKFANDRNLDISFSLKTSEGDYTYTVRCKEGGGTISSPVEGKGFTPQIFGKGDLLKFTLTIPQLEYNCEYTISAFVMIKGNEKIFSKLFEYSHIHKKVEAIPVIRRSTDKNEILLDFVGNQWPVEFGKNDSSTAIAFACRTDHFPDNIDDGMNDFAIKIIDYSSYRQGIFKVKCNTRNIPPVLYISGWLLSSGRPVKQVVRNAIYEIYYQVKNNVLIIDENIRINNVTVPKFDFYAFDRKDRVIASEKNVELDPSELQWSFTPSGKVNSVLVEASDMLERQICLFRNSKSGETGKVKIGLGLPWF